MAEAHCRACFGPIRWAKTLRGASIPLDADPHEDGNVALTPAGALMLTPEMVESGKAAGTRRYRPHFVTCPFADRFKKKSKNAN
jgi:hypothetical protein